MERQTELVQFTADATGATCTFRSPTGVGDVRTEWLLGCDGAHSAVRHGLGIAFPGNTLDRRWMLADFEIAGENRPPADQVVIKLAHGVNAAFPMGGARWRLVGDTLWLGNDYVPYFHPMIEERIVAIERKKYGLSVMDTSIINKRPRYPVSDAVYWSKTFRDTVTACAPEHDNPGGCPTWVYKVSKKDDKLYLERIESLSRATKSVATRAILTRDSLANCEWGRVEPIGPH